MEKIEGVSLEDELQIAEKELLADSQRKVRAMIAGILSDIMNWRRERQQLDKQREKLDGKIRSAEEKYNKLKAGDWSVLNENMTKNQPSSEV